MDTTEKIRDQMAAHDTETALGEPEWWIYLESGRSVEITYESAGIAPEDGYCSVRLHCSEKEFDCGDYRTTCGVIDQCNTESLRERTVDDVKAEAARLATELIEGHHETVSTKQ